MRSKNRSLQEDSLSLFSYIICVHTIKLSNINDALILASSYKHAQYSLIVPSSMIVVFTIREYRCTIAKFNAC